MHKVFIFRDAWQCTIKKFIEEQQKYGIKNLFTKIDKIKGGYILTVIINTEDTHIIFESLLITMKSAALKNEKSINKIYKNYVRSKNRKNNQR